MVASWRACYYAFTIGTGLDPEGGGPTMGGWRSWGSDVEEDFEGLGDSEDVD